MPLLDNVSMKELFVMLIFRKIIAKIIKPRKPPNLLRMFIIAGEILEEPV